MSTAVAYERVRTLTVRSTWIVIGLYLTVAIGLPLLLIRAAASDEETTKLTFAAGVHTQIGWVLALTIGALAIGPEFNHKTIRLALTEFPVRGRLFTAKALVASAFTAILGLVGWALGWAIGATALEGGAEVATLLNALARQEAYLIGWCLIGLAVATLLRSTALGVVIPLVFALIVENLLPFLLRRPELVEWFPGYNANQVLQEDPLSAVAVWRFGLWVVLLLAAAFAAFRNRDV
jgi:ABC-2 type transport system permease protein